MKLVGYLAPEGLEEALAQELTGIVEQYGRLFLAEGEVQKVHWAQNIWYAPEVRLFHSISDAARILRSLGALWALYPNVQIRRSELIARRLPFFSAKPHSFPIQLPKTPLGSWTLLDAQTLLASSHCHSPFPNGEASFIETKAPPSRAYLKLWEFFTLFGRAPGLGEKCLEIGASPGGWTWTLQRQGAQVIAIDRSPLAPSLASLPKIQFLKQDAFSLRAEEFPDVDWVFSDVVCYPDKLLGWITPWLERDVSLVCTLKFQGKKDYRVIQEFEKIPDSCLVHLFHNKHELTWSRLRKERDLQV